MNVRINKDKEEFMLKGKEILKDKGISITTAVKRLFKKLVNNPEKTIKFLLID